MGDIVQNNEIKGINDEPLKETQTVQPEDTKKSDEEEPKDANGFPLSKCQSTVDLLSGKCFSTSKPVKIVDASSEIGENISNAVLHFAATTGAVGVNKILDLLFFTILGVDNINKANKETVFKQLEQKTSFIQEMSADPEAKRLVKKLSASLALIILEGTEAAREPLLRAFNGLIKSSFEGLYNVTSEGAKFASNTIKLTPGVGDAFIILENALSVGKGASNLANTAVSNAVMAASTSKKITENISDSVSKVSENTEFGETLKDLKKVKEKLESKLGQTVADVGNTVSSGIQKVTPVIKGGKKQKKGKKTKKLRKRRVRFNIK